MLKNIKNLTLLLVGVILIGCGSSREDDAIVKDDEPIVGLSPVVATFQTLYEYAPFIKPIAGLGYAVYKNDGEFNTGMVMTVLNPEGTILKNQDYEISLLNEMQDTLWNMQTQLNTIGNQLNDILQQIGLAKAEILTNINDPAEHIDNISTVSEQLDILAKTNNPHSADKKSLTELSDSILSSSINGNILGELNHVHSAVTAYSAGKTPLLSSFTDQLIIGLGSNPDSNDLVNAYKSLEYYTMQLIGAEVEATNLLVDASFYREDNSSARLYYKKLHDNINDYFDTSKSYSFTNNALRLVLRYADPYYDKPNESGSFFAPRSEDIFQRIEFLKNIMLETKDKSSTTIYRISENKDVERLYAQPSPQGLPNPTFRCEPSEPYSVMVPAYDHWSETEGGLFQLDLVNEYKVTTYTCDYASSGYKTYIFDEGANILTTLAPSQRYNDGMELDDDGAYVYSFYAISDRDSAGFERLAWQECSDQGYLDDRFYNDNEGFFDNNNYLSTSEYVDFLKDPLNNLFLITLCKDVSAEYLYDIDKLSDQSAQNCEVDHSQVYDMISMCSNTFTYVGENDNFGINTRLERKYLADAKHGGLTTDGKIYLGAGLFFEDVTSGGSDTIYKKSDKTKIQGEEYNFSDAKTFHVKISLKEGHKYRLLTQMAAQIEQGTTITKGFASMKLEKKRKIRFMYPWDKGTQ